ncbi:MAG: CTP-dependent riboflavin kinase [Methanothrix sp.]|nr:CTP-dependent riboflavin kinase [Methanothrix sp.]
MRVPVGHQKDQGTADWSIRGRVVSGLGDGRYYISRYSDRIRERLGFTPFPGTLNILLDGPFSPPERLSIRIEGFEEAGRSFGECILVRIRIGGIGAALIRPARSSHPEEVVEVIAPANLRERLRLSDGDQVEIVLESEQGSSLP